MISYVLRSVNFLLRLIGRKQLDRPITDRTDLFHLWFERLRSGKYIQVRGTSKTHNGYCALGLLFEILVENNYGEWAGATFIPHFKDSRDEILKRFVGTDFWGVVRLNDDLRFSFEEIANVLEASMNGLSRTK
jgi:hypothetical protein